MREIQIDRPWGERTRWAGGIWPDRGYNCKLFLLLAASI